LIKKPYSGRKTGKVLYGFVLLRKKKKKTLPPRHDNSGEKSAPTGKGKSTRDKTNLLAPEKGQDLNKEPDAAPPGKKIIFAPSSAKGTRSSARDLLQDWPEKRRACEEKSSEYGRLCLEIMKKKNIRKRKGPGKGRPTSSTNREGKASGAALRRRE